MFRSPLKYPGGKADLLKSGFTFPKSDRFIEPFAGSAICSLNSASPHLVIADSNWDIVNFFRQISLGHADTILYKCEEYWKAEADLRLASMTKKDYENLDTDEQKGSVKYHVLRTLFNTLKAQDKDKHALKLACLFLYLNRHGFNGLCRYNQKGDYNVPYGKHVNPYFPEREVEETQRIFTEKDSVTLLCCDYEDLDEELSDRTETPIGAWDVIYCDPPYSPLDGKTAFTTYDGNEFDEADHEWLYAKCKIWRNQGATVILSNSDTSFTRNLYKQQRVEYRQSKRSISANAEGRKKTNEVIVYFNK